MIDLKRAQQNEIMIQQLILQISSNIFGSLVANYYTEEKQCKPEDLRKLAKVAQQAGPFLAEAYGLVVINEQTN